MSRLTNLIEQVTQRDPQLGADLEQEFKALSRRRAFGLNFERHCPETVELPWRSVRKGDKVRVLPERGSAKNGDQRLWRVIKISLLERVRVAHLELINGLGKESKVVLADDLAVVAESRDLIYPGMISTGAVERGGDKPFHAVINGENYHVLKALTYTHWGKFDIAYIDPPYNTGARDWKYNNYYVEANDSYRHSKWLTFMERRLRLAKKLLNPQDSALIVTIDEKEVNRLALLLEQVFEEANIQMVPTVINPQGTGGNNEFSRTHEYLLFVMIGNSSIKPTSDNMFDRQESSTDVPIEWRNLRRRERESVRGARPNQFYPVFVDEATGRIYSVGDALPDDVPATSVHSPPGTRAVFPLNPRGEEKLWGVIPERLRFLAKHGYARVKDGNVQFLNGGTVKAIEAGDIQVVGSDEYGGIVGTYQVGQKILMPKTIWVRPSHNSQSSGTLLLKRLLPDRNFPFPKSLYAVEDALRFFVKEKPDAVILDFFAGSGTTAHAVMRLNRQDRGRRQCILVTNNEVSADEQNTLRMAGLRPGDQEWEQYGIYDFITKPRIGAAITGRTLHGEPVEGDYKFTDEFPMANGFDENAEFLTLTYESPVMVGHNRAFARIAPLLWMRAGSQGRRIEDIPENGWQIADTYGVLVDLDQATPFCEAIVKREGLRVVYIVTDDDRRFQAVALRLPGSVESVRLYESYLANFRFVNGD